MYLWRDIRKPLPILVPHRCLQKAAVALLTLEDFRFPARIIPNEVIYSCDT